MSITPYNYLTSADSVKLRAILLNETTIIKIVDYEESQRVFTSSTQAVMSLPYSNERYVQQCSRCIVSVPLAALFNGYTQFYGFSQSHGTSERSDSGFRSCHFAKQAVPIRN